MCGEAENVPVTTGTVDAVINVESSHCYPSRLRFFEEVARILRPGGYFLYADLFFAVNDKSELPAQVSVMLEDLGFVIETCRDLTQNVLAARDAVSHSSALRSIQSRMRDADLSSLDMAIFQEAFALKGTALYAEMASGRIPYSQWRAVKSAGGNLPQ